MRPRFQADADFNHKLIRGLRRREPPVDFQDAHGRSVIGLPDREVLSIAAGALRAILKNATEPRSDHRRSGTRHRPEHRGIAADLGRD